MPFRSQAQWRWAFANKKPFAKKWADETPQKLTTLPKRVSKAMMGASFPMTVNEETTEKTFQSQPQSRWLFANSKPQSKRSSRETLKKLSRFRDLSIKAATTGNFSARAGEKIGGNQCRDANGHFVNCDDVNAVGPKQQGQQGSTPNTYAGSSMAAYEAATEEAKIIENERKKLEKKRIRAGLGLDTPSKGGGGISPAERKRQEREGQKKNEASAHGAVGPGAALGAALSNFADPDRPGMLPNITAMRLEQLGLVEMSPRTGKPYITGEGRAYINAARSGDMFAAREAMQRAQDMAIQKTEAEQMQQQEQLARAEEEAFQQELEMIQGSPRDLKRQAAMDRVARRNRASAGSSRKPAKRETNNVYGSGKVTVGSPKSTVKQVKNVTEHYIPATVLDTMLNGYEVANRHKFEHAAMRFIEKGLKEEGLDRQDVLEMHTWHKSLKEKHATEDAPTADWFVYQLLGAQHGFYWVDSIMASYEMALSSYKSKKSDFNRRPSATASVNAIRGLDLQYAFKRGGSKSKISLGEKIANGDDLADREIKAMHDYLSSHQGDRKLGWAKMDNPSVEYIDWMIHGGDEGLQWSAEKLRMTEKREKAKAETIDRIPSPTAATNSVRGLDLQHEYKRGGSESMIALGRRIANGFSLNDDEIRDMHAYLHRHSGDRKEGWADMYNPSAAYINWMIHGGDEGLQWASDKIDSLKLKREKLIETKGRRDDMMRKNPSASSSATSDFVFPNEKRFPITDYGSVTDALNSWPQYRGLSKYEDFQRNLTAIAQRKGLVSALPKAWRKNIENASENVVLKNYRGRHDQRDHGNGRRGTGSSDSSTTTNANAKRRGNARTSILTNANRKRNQTGAGLASDSASSSVSRVFGGSTVTNANANVNQNPRSAAEWAALTDSRLDKIMSQPPSEEEARRRTQIVADKPMSDSQLARIENALNAIRYDSTVSGTFPYTGPWNTAMSNLLPIARDLGVDWRDMADMYNRYMWAEHVRTGMSAKQQRAYNTTRRNTTNIEDLMKWSDRVDEEVKQRIAENGGPKPYDSDMVKYALRWAETDFRDVKNLGIAHIHPAKRQGLIGIASSLGVSVRDLYKMVKEAGTAELKKPMKKRNTRAPVETEEWSKGFMQRNDQDQLVFTSNDVASGNGNVTEVTNANANRGGAQGTSNVPQDTTGPRGPQNDEERNALSGYSYFQGRERQRAEQGMRSDPREAQAMRDIEARLGSRRDAVLGLTTRPDDTARVSFENEQRAAEMAQAQAEFEMNQRARQARAAFEAENARVMAESEQQVYEDDKRARQGRAETASAWDPTAIDRARQEQVAIDAAYQQKRQADEARVAAENARRAQEMEQAQAEFEADQRRRLEREAAASAQQQEQQAAEARVAAENAARDQQQAQARVAAENAARDQQQTQAQAALNADQQRRQAASSVTPARRQQIMGDARMHADMVNRYGADGARGSAQALERYAQELGVSVEELNAMIFGGMSKSTVKAHAGGKDSFSPPAGVRSAAKRGLELRSKFGRGGTSVGIARGRDLSNGKGVSASTIRRMNSFFARHAVDKRPDWSNPSKPSNGYIAHLLWGGDAGRAWASKISRHLDAKEKEYPSYVFNSNIDIYRHRNDEMLRKEQQRHRMQYSIKTRRQKAESTIKAFEYETTKGKNKPSNPSLWSKAVAEAKKKYRVYPSAYANGYAAKWYKKNGGTWKTEKDLREWFAEKWVDISRPKKGGGYEPCGRRTEGMSESDYRKKYPKCVPASRAAKMSNADRESAISSKRRDGLPKGGAPQNVATRRETKSTIIPSNADLSDALKVRANPNRKSQGAGVLSAIVNM